MARGHEGETKSLYAKAQEWEIKDKESGSSFKLDSTKRYKYVKYDAPQPEVEYEQQGHSTLPADMGRQRPEPGAVLHSMA